MSAFDPKQTLEVLRRLVDRFVGNFTLLLMKRLLALSLLASGASAEPLPVASPFGPWVVDFDRSHCIASQDYVVDGKKVIVGIEAIPTRNERDLSISSPGKLFTIVMDDASIFVGDKPIRARVMFGEPITLKGYVRDTTRLNEAEYRLLIGTAQLTVTAGRVKAVFRFTNLQGVDAQLRKCNGLLLESWGFSQSAQDNLASFPQPQGGEYKLGQISYPETSAERGAVGGVRVALMIDPTGTVSNCSVVQSSGHAELDSQTCSHFTGEKLFVPAKDKQGRPISAPYVFSTRFVSL